MKGQGVCVVAADIELRFRKSKTFERSDVDEHGTFQRGLGCLVVVKDPAAPGEALGTDVIKPDQPAAGAVLALDHIVELAQVSLARLVAFDPTALVCCRSSDFRQMNIVFGIRS